MIKEIKIKALQKQNGFLQALLFFFIVATVFACNTVCFFINREAGVSTSKKAVFNAIMLLTSIVMIIFIKMLKLDLKGKNVKFLAKLFGFELILFFVKTALFILFFSPAAVSAYLLYKMSKTDFPFFSVALCFVFCLITVVICFCFFGKSTRSLFLAENCFIVCEKAMDSIRSSIALMNKNTGKLLLLRISFSGWFALCIFIFPLPFVHRYYRNCLSVFTERLTALPHNS